ncbi:hypothetical protein C8R43DRAFT_909613 [Mycena crocata]|nr:hypothetical protein C8R43DRAFT_909613 [Mycena crocata]
MGTKYHIAALQEPYIGRGGETRANSHWMVVYPTGCGVTGTRARAVTLMNDALPTDSWS